MQAYLPALLICASAVAMIIRATRHSFRGFAALLACLLFLSSAAAQERKGATIPFEGPEIFAHVLDGQKIKPILTIKDAAKNPRGTTIIVLGNPSILEKIQATSGLSRFLEQGGNLLIATDHSMIQPSVPVLIAGYRVTAPRSYRGKIDCPFLHYDDGAGPGPRNAVDHPCFRSLHGGIATNCPSYVQIHDQRTRVQPLLYIAGSRVVANLSGPKDISPVPKGQLSRVYMAGSPKGTPPHGRALFIGGHGMFMNGMMAQKDSDNYPFTNNMVRWLCEGADGKTPRHALFVYDGRIIADFNMNLTPPPEPIPFPTIEMINRLLRGLEQERFFHRVLGDILGPTPTGVILVVLGLITFAVLLYGAKRFMHGRSRLDTGVPSMVGVPALASASAPIEERQQALLRKEDFWSESRQLALEWFRRELDVAPDHWHAGVQATLQAEGSMLARWRMQGKADFALALARTTDAVPISRHQFFVLVETLRELSRALADGRLALLVDGKNVRK